MTSSVTDGILYACSKNYRLCRVNSPAEALGLLVDGCAVQVRASSVMRDPCALTWRRSFLVFPGNFSSHVTRALERRPWWRPARLQSSDWRDQQQAFHFAWKPVLRVGGNTYGACSCLGGMHCR